MSEQATPCCDVVCRGKVTPGCAMQTTPRTVEEAAWEALDRATRGDDPTTWAGTPWWHVHLLLALADSQGARLAAVLALCDEITDAAAYGHKVGHPANHGQRAHDIDRIRRAAAGEAT